MKSANFQNKRKARRERALARMLVNKPTYTTAASEMQRLQERIDQPFVRTDKYRSPGDVPAGRSRGMIRSKIKR